MADDPATAADDTHFTVVPAPPEVALTEIALEGQPATDKAYRTATGTCFRARVVTIQRQDTVAPVNGAGVKVAAAGVNLSLTLAVLDARMDVATDSAGELLITNTHEIVWGDPAHANPDFDPAADLMTILRQEAYRLETRMAKRSAVADVLSQWGGAPIAAADPVQPLLPATSSTTVAELLAAAEPSTEPATA
ncbi:hypothetical protein [Sphingomonas morindae]|uniref:Uncharacterized protein n=1 Tax=Sphingomonas morindae TaxID=1541170 RepID=A0ABY4X400_9SPHN|nr:hypothetical protein [Sphingomonas morindae]USI71609.1 hypothetical protein LHA26_09695 [Sphingomonas morindae]